MNEVKNPKKPLIYYACIVAAVLLAFNLIVALPLCGIRWKRLTTENLCP